MHNSEILCPSVGLSFCKCVSQCEVCNNKSILAVSFTKNVMNGKKIEIQRKSE